MNAPKYVSIESTTCLNFILLTSKIKESIKRAKPDLSEKDFIGLMHKNLKAFKINDQEFDYVSNGNYLGGVRWYVKCPKCGAPSLKLYLPSDYKDREQKYLCKDCHKLKNACLILGTSKRYVKVIKPLKKLEGLRNKLLSRGITPDKAKPLLEEYERIEKELAASPEYRLYRFQKEHGMPL